MAESEHPVCAVLRPIFFAVGYLLAAEVGQSLSFPGDFASFWPPSGLYLAVLILTAPRKWWRYCVAAVVANVCSDVLLHGKPPALSLGFSAANTLEAMAGALALKHFLGHPMTFGRLKDVLVFGAVGGILAPAAGAAVAASVIMAAGGGPWSAVWARWWVSGSVGVVVVTPVVVKAIRFGHLLFHSARPARIAETLFLLTGVAFVCDKAFGGQAYPMAWSVAPLLLWAALRFDNIGVMLAVGIMAVVSSWHTGSGHGVFGSLPAPYNLLLLQAYIGVLGVSFLAVGAVVQERRELARTVLVNERRFRVLFDRMEEHVLSVDPEGWFLDANRAAAAVVGYTPEEFLKLHFSQVVHPEDLPLCENAVRRNLAGEKIGDMRFRIVSKTGAVIEVEGYTEFRFDDDGTPMYSLSVFRDVTERNRQQRLIEEYRVRLEAANIQLAELARTDDLTQLKNRRAFQEKLDEEVKRSARCGQPLSVLLIDVDQFKSFNDSFGHPAGDKLLCQVARLLEDTARSSDFVARFGGEEFVCLLPNTDAEGALVIGERLRRVISDAHWEARAITVSVGVSTTSADDFGGSRLVDAADLALYESKHAGRNRVTHGNGLSGVPALNTAAKTALPVG